MKGRSAWVAMALAAVVAVASGCGSSSDDSGSTGSTSSSTAAAGTTASAGATTESAPAWLTDAQQAAKAATQKPTKILSESLGPFTPKPDGSFYHVACNMALEGCAKIANAVKAGTQALGYSFKLCDGGTTADKIGQCFTNAINAKPDAIETNGIGADAAADSFAKVAEADIPLVGSFTGDKIPTANVTTEIGGDSCAKGAENLANWVIAHTEGKANVLFVGTKTYTCNIQRQEAFLKTLAKCETCSSKTLEFAIDGVQSQLPQQLQSALQSNLDVNFVVGTFDAVALAAADAIRQAGKADSIKVAGFDGDAPNLKMIKNGDIQVADDVTGSQEPGWAAADAMARAMAGKKLPPNVRITDMIIDKTNAAEIGTYEGPTGFREQFKALWGG